MKKLALMVMFISGLCSAAMVLFAEKEESRKHSGNSVREDGLVESIDTYLTRCVPFGFSGAMLVGRHGKILLNKGYGLAVRADNIPNTAQTIFSTGSITKQFTAAGIMKLEMQDKLQTSDSILKYFSDTPDDKRSITLHHLLTHTSGLVDSVGPDYRPTPKDEVISAVLSSPLQFSPGEEFSYSNAGYTLLAAVIEKVSGQDYESFLREYLFLPAGMNNTGYRLPDWSGKTIAHWYVGGKDNRTPLEKPYPTWYLIGNGGILSTTDDMFLWHQALLKDEIISREAKSKMFTPCLNDYGYGWDVLESDWGLLIQHDGGSMLGSSAEMRRYIDEGIVTIVFCNQSYGRQPGFDPVREKIETLAFGGTVQIPPEVSAPGREDTTSYSGIYSIPGGGSFEVRGDDGKLVLIPSGQKALDLLYQVDSARSENHALLNSWVVDLFVRAQAGDFSLFKQVLSDASKRLEPVKELIEMRLRRYREKTGEIKKVIGRITLPVSFQGDEASQTFVELVGERGSIFFSLFWRDKINIGVAPAMGIPDLSIPFIQVKDREFAGYRLDTARPFFIHFQDGESGSVQGLAVGKGSAEASAWKKQDR